jgi:hypothetical protein
LTAAKIESYYRSSEGFSQETIEIVGEAVTSLARVLQAVGRSFRLNKATLLTWLLVVVRDLMHELHVELAEAMTAIEISRGAQRRSDGWVYSDERLENRVARSYLSLYNDRASLRVTDVLSVVARDVAIWRLLEFIGRRPPGTDFERLSEMLRQIEQDPLGLPNLVLELLEDPETWGGL